MTYRHFWVSIALCVGSASAWGQSSTSLTEKKGRPAAKYEEIERGFYFNVYTGPFYMLNPPAESGGESPFSPGQIAQVGMGMDFGSHVAIEVLLLATANRAGANYQGKSKGRASGDFGSLIPGAAAKVSLVGFEDGNDVKRFWIYARAGGGYSFFFPSALLPESDILVFGGLGAEYFTRLRHFSIGIEASGQYFIGGGALGFAITPSVRYAF